MSHKCLGYLCVILSSAGVERNTKPGAKSNEVPPQRVPEQLPPSLICMSVGTDIGGKERGDPSLSLAPGIPGERDEPHAPDIRLEPFVCQSFFFRFPSMVSFFFCPARVVSYGWKFLIPLVKRFDWLEFVGLRLGFSWEAHNSSRSPGFSPCWVSHIRSW